MFVYWAPRLMWRFLTGLHMDGKVRRHQNGKVKPQFKNYWWNRYSRLRKAVIRQCIVVVMFGTIIGAMVDWWLTRFALLSLVPFGALWLGRKALSHFTMVQRFTDSDGAPEVYRSLKPKYYRRWQKVKGYRFKLAPPTMDAIPPDAPESRAILADIAEDHGEPVTFLGRPRGLAELQASEAAPQDRRARSFQRAAKRRGKAS